MFRSPVLVLGRSLALLLLLVHCAPSRPPSAPLAALPSPAALTEQEEQRATHLLRTLERAERAYDHAAATAMREALLKQYPSSEAAATLYEAHARRAERAGATAEALDQYEHLLLLRPQFVRIDEARLAYAVLLVRGGRAADAVELYRGQPSGAAAEASEARRQRLALALIEPLAEAGQPQLALPLVVDACHFAGASEAERERQAERLPALVAALTDEQADALLRSHGGAAEWHQVAPRLALRVAKSPLLRGDVDEQKRLLRGVVRLDTSGVLAEEANRLLVQQSALEQVDPRTLGVALPLTGRFKHFGERCLAAIELALGSAPNVTLVVKDTQGDPNLAQAAIESLAFEHHAVAAIGPMFSAESVAAANRAEALGLPLLSLSHQEDLTKTGRFIFRTGLTVAAQARALAKTAFEDLGFRRFALMGPNNRFGQTFLQAFWDEVEARQGSIRGVEFYQPDATTFRQPIRKLVGRWFLNARPEFHEKLEALKEQELPAVKMRAEVAKLDKQSRPIVDFDALVIPDSGRQLGLIAPALAFEDIALSRDAKELERMRRTLNQNEIVPITLLGASTWNNQQTLDACERYCESAVFVDAFFAASEQPSVRSFLTAFSAKVGAEPMLSEAQAYDTAGLLASVLMGKEPPTSRHQLVERLHAIGQYDGVCGRMRFDADGEIERDLQALTIHARHIEALSSAASSLPPAPVVR